MIIPYCEHVLTWEIFFVTVPVIFKLPPFRTNTFYVCGCFACKHACILHICWPLAGRQGTGSAGPGVLEMVFVGGGGTGANLSSSISRLDSLSESWRHSASLLSISLWSFRCSRRFSSLMCRSSSKYWAIFSESGKPELAIKPCFTKPLPHIGLALPRETRGLKFSLSIKVYRRVTFSK